MKDILTAPFMAEMIRTAANMYAHGWDERNGGNISLILEESEVKEYLDTNSMLRTIPTGSRQNHHNDKIRHGFRSRPANRLQQRKLIILKDLEKALPDVYNNFNEGYNCHCKVSWRKKIWEAVIGRMRYTSVIHMHI